MAGGKPVVVTTEAREVLENATIDGDVITIGDTLPDAVWRTVKKLLEFSGGRYVTGASAWRFLSPAADIIAEILAAGQVVADRHSAGYVPTPTGLAQKLVGLGFAGLADLPAGAKVLEPSAGDGQLVRAITAANPGVGVVALEPDQRRFDRLAASTGGDAELARSLDRLVAAASGQVELVRSTIEDYAPSCSERFDAAVLNPPFSITGQRDIWISHVLIAYGLLKRGGQLAAIVPDSYSTGTGGLLTVLRDLVDSDGSYTRLAAGQFPGVGIAVGILIINRPVRDDRPSYLYRARDEHSTPTFVEAPRLSWAAALHTPVQTRYDAWRGVERVFRNVGRCVLCHEPVWEFDDGENDPRGVLGQATSSPLVAGDHDMTGPSVLRCWATDCSTGDAYNKALAIAQDRHWKPAPATDGRAAAAAELADAVRQALPAGMLR